MSERKLRKAAVITAALILILLVSLDVEINPRFYRGIVKRAELQQKWRGECQAERL